MKQRSANLRTVDRYAQLELQTDVESATPHRIILMLFDGALEKCRAARNAMTRGDIGARGEAISWGISIIDGLRASLDLEQGGEIAQNLDSLYEYMTRVLVEANLAGEPGKLDEVISLLDEIRAGWKGIEAEVGALNGPMPMNHIGPTAVGLG